MEDGRWKKEDGSSATSNVRDVTDVSPSEEGRRTKEEGRRKKEEGRRKKEEISRKFLYPIFHLPLSLSPPLPIFPSPYLPLFPSPYLYCWFPSMRSRKSFTVNSKPRSSGTVGSHPNQVLARVISGCRCFGSSSGRGLKIISAPGLIMF